jgi:cob(I)alamin adenosyltransferase
MGRKVTMIAISSQAARESYLDQFDECVPTLDAALERAAQLARDAGYDLIVLDNINPLLDRGVIHPRAVRELVQGKAKPVTVVFTGRSAPDWLVAIADIVTDFAEVKHPIHAGVGPRRGIEF